MYWRNCISGIALIDLSNTQTLTNVDTTQTAIFKLNPISKVKVLNLILQSTLVAFLKGFHDIFLCHKTNTQTCFY